MISIIKSQMYRLKKETLLYIVYPMIVLTCYIISFLQILNEEAPGVSEAFVLVMPVFGSLLILFWCVVVTVCADEFADKTYYLEIMGGKQRVESYLSRILFYVMVNYIACVGIIMLPLYLQSFTFSMGEAFVLADMWKRCLVMFFPVFKFTCECCMLCFLTRKSLAGAGIAGALSLLGFFAGSAAGGFSHIFTLHSLRAVFNFVGFQTYTFSQPVITIYKAAMDEKDVIGTIVSGLAVGLFCLVIGIFYHKKDDLN